MLIYEERSSAECKRKNSNTVQVKRSPAVCSLRVHTFMLPCDWSRVSCIDMRVNDSDKMPVVLPPAPVPAGANEKSSRDSAVL